MKCENCGNLIEVVPADGRCQHCDVWLTEELWFGIPPFTTVKRGKSFLTFGKDDVWLSVKNPKVPRTELRVPYNEVFDVSFVPGTKVMRGFLCIRDWHARHVPLPKNHWERKLRDSIMFFERQDNVTFYRAYEFLKRCVAINAKARNE